MIKKLNRIFKFKPFSDKQRKVLNWWCPDSPVKKSEGIIADGAIRSGKTLCMSLSFVMWAMTSFDRQNFGMCGKTIGSFRRNVLFWLKLMLKSRGYSVTDHRTDNLVIVTRGETENFFFIFGGKDERSQDLIQGITLAGCFFDEVALMPKSFVNQATGRCSVDESKFWFNCNPSNPKHWFKTDWIDKRVKKKLLYLHFTMDDNLSLSEKIKKRYRNMYDGVFYDRYIKGLWVAAEGVIYQAFANNPVRYLVKKDNLPLFMEINAAFDPGGTKSKHAFVASGITPNYKKLIALRSERHDAEETKPSDLDKLACDFVGKVIKEYGRLDYLYYDNEASVLGRGIKQAVESKYPSVSVRPCFKGEIKDRIDLEMRLIGLGAFGYTEDCDTLKQALEEALWDEKHDDERLDDGTTDIDSLDAFEYTFTRQIKRFVNQGRIKG